MSAFELGLPHGPVSAAYGDRLADIDTHRLHASPMRREYAAALRDGRAVPAHLSEGPFTTTDRSPCP
jgi:hypothetical protein